MENNKLTDPAYKTWLRELKQKVRQTQLKAAVQVNSAVLQFYWELGADIVEKQKTAPWGSGFLKQLSVDLMAEFPDMTGFSKRNLERIRMWHLFYSERVANCDTACVAIDPSVVAQIVQIPWSHNLVIVSKCQDVSEARYYVQKTMENSWSRAVLTHQIESGLYQREGKALTNFTAGVEELGVSVSPKAKHKETPAPVYRKRQRKGFRGQQVYIALIQEGGQ